MQWSYNLATKPRMFWEWKGPIDNYAGKTGKDWVCLGQSRVRLILHKAFFCMIANVSYTMPGKYVLRHGCFSPATLTE